jgi:hypothetical protein
MLFKFKSKATSDLIMLEPDARVLLKMMLGDDPVKGIVLAQDLPATIAKLESALAQESAHEASAKVRLHDTTAGLDNSEDGPLVEAVLFSQRAAPMLQMLKRCMAENADLVWGV